MFVGKHLLCSLYSPYNPPPLPPSGDDQTKRRLVTADIPGARGNRGRFSSSLVVLYYIYAWNFNCKQSLSVASLSTYIYFFFSRVPLVCVCVFLFVPGFFSIFFLGNALCPARNLHKLACVAHRFLFLFFAFSLFLFFSGTLIVAGESD